MSDSDVLNNAVQVRVEKCYGLALYFACTCPIAVDDKRGRIASL